VARLTFDEDMGKQLEVVYGSRDVMRRRRLVREALAPVAGERLLDAGCGPGFYAAELAELVGEGGAVVGVDESSDMLGLAAGRNEGRANVSFALGSVTALPVEDEDFDGAVCVQVLEYVPDVEAALGELHRALRPGGRLVVWDVDWGTVSWHTKDPERMARVLAAWDEHLADPILPHRLAALMRATGFEDVRCEGHEFVTAEFTPDAYTAALLPIVKQYVKDGGLVPEDELEAWAAEQLALAQAGEYYCACVQVCFTGRKPAAG
jgi:arsenite methyltransferase